MLHRLLQRERTVVLSGVATLGGLAWLELFRQHRGMAMDVALPHAMPWHPADLGAAVVMWSVMMVAMMLPSAAPMLLLFTNLQRKNREQGRAATPTSLFTAGYLVVWIAWSALAAALQWALQALLVLSPHLATTSAVLGGCFLLLAGIYQFTPWKYACLAQCQSPLGFLLTKWREGPWGALAMGAHHGAYCVGCCWALMGLLFVGGVMNLLWVAGLAAFVLLEKAVARGPWLSRIAGLGFACWGIYALFSGLS